MGGDGWWWLVLLGVSAWVWWAAVLRFMHWVQSPSAVDSSKHGKTSDATTVNFSPPRFRSAPALRSPTRSARAAATPWAQRWRGHPHLAPRCTPSCLWVCVWGGVRGEGGKGWGGVEVHWGVGGGLLLVGFEVRRCGVAPKKVEGPLAAVLRIVFAAHSVGVLGCLRGPPPQSSSPASTTTHLCPRTAALRPALFLAPSHTWGPGRWLGVCVFRVSIGAALSCAALCLTAPVNPPHPLVTLNQQNILNVLNPQHPPHTLPPPPHPMRTWGTGTARGFIATTSSRPSAGMP